MTVEKTTAQEDLAFLRQLVSPDADAAQRREFGRIYALWGAAFAVPLLMEWARMIGVAPLPDNFWLLAVGVVTAGIIAASVWASRKARPTVGTQARAWNAVFSGVGWANLAVLVGLVLVAQQLRDGRVMMVHAVVVFAFQGAAWYAGWALRKRIWTGVVAAGWFAAAAVMGAAVATPSTFVLLGAVFLILLMVVPGLALARAGRPD